MAPRFHLVLGCDTHGNVVLGGKAWAERGDEDDDEKCVLWFDTLVDEGTDSYADQKRRWWFAHIRDALTDSSDMADATDMLECIRDDVPWTNMWYPVFLSIKFNGTRLADIPNEAFQFDDCDLEDFDYAFGAYRDLVKMGCGHHEDFDLEMCDKQDYGSQDITDYNEDDEFVCVICEAERKAEETAKTVRHEKMEVAIAKAVTKKGPARGEKEDTVYYIEAVGQNIIKIGHSIDPQTRRKNLQTVPTVKLVVLATEPGGQPKEALRHAEFTAIRLSPDVEWFHKTPELLAHIERLAADTSCQP